MKLIIAGSRSFIDYELMVSECDKLVTSIDVPITEIISGGARGADTLAEQYAASHNYNFLLFEADWDKYNKRAGFLRNVDMAKYGDVLIVFWDGISKGTSHMIRTATQFGLPVTTVLCTPKQTTLTWLDKHLEY